VRQTTREAAATAGSARAGGASGRETQLREIETAHAAARNAATSLLAAPHGCGHHATATTSGLHVLALLVLLC